MLKIDDDNIQFCEYVAEFVDGDLIYLPLTDGDTCIEYNKKTHLVKVYFEDKVVVLEGSKLIWEKDSHKCGCTTVYST